MLAEMAVADAYAIAWEFTDKQTGENNLQHFYQHPTYAALKPGQYTDDTQRAIANVEVMLTGNPMDLFTPISYACHYVDAYKRDRRDGYSRGFQALLDSVDDGAALLMNVRRNKNSNGSVMGVAPLGYISDVASVKLAAGIQALTTHNSNTIVDAQIVALAVHYLVHEIGDRSNMGDFIMEHVDWLDGAMDRKVWLGELSEYSMDALKPTTIKARSISAYAVHQVLTGQSLSQIIKDAVRRGGDTDSAAACSVAIASCCPEIVNDIPVQLTLTLDQCNPNYGIGYLSTLENRLRAAYKGAL